MPVTSRSFAGAAGVVVAVVAMLALTIVSIGTVKHHTAAERFVAEVGPLEPEKYAPEPVSDIENATRWIQKGVDAMKFQNETSGEKGDRHWIELCGTDGLDAIPPGELPTVRATLTRNEAAFADLEKAVALSRSNWNIEYGKGVEAEIPNLLGAIRTAKAMTCDARLAFADGDPARAVRRLEALGRMARSYEDEPALIVLLIGIAIERYQLVALRDLLASPATTPDSLLALDAALSDAPLRERWRRAVAAYVAMTHRTLQRTGAPGDHHRAGRWEGLVQRTVWSIAGPWWMSDQLSRTTEFHKRLGTVPVRSQASFAATLSSRPWWTRVFPDDANLLNGMERAASAETQRRLARRAIALRLTASVTGRYPASLDPPSNAEDDPFSGEPFAWTVAPDGSATLAAATTAKEAAKVVLNAREAWWTFPLPAPTPAAAPASSSTTTPDRPDRSPSPPPPAGIPPR